MSKVCPLRVLQAEDETLESALELPERDNAQRKGANQEDFVVLILKQCLRGSHRHHSVLDQLEALVP